EDRERESPIQRARLQGCRERRRQPRSCCRRKREILGQALDFSQWTRTGRLSSIAIGSRRGELTLKAMKRRFTSSQLSPAKSFKMQAWRTLLAAWTANARAAGLRRAH